MDGLTRRGGGYVYPPPPYALRIQSRANVDTSTITVRQKQMRKIGYSNEVGTNARIFETEFQAVESTTEIPKWKVWRIPDRNYDIIFDTDEYLGNLIHRLNGPFGIDYDYWYLWTPNNGDILKISFELDIYRNSIN